MTSMMNRRNFVNNFINWWVILVKADNQIFIFIFRIKKRKKKDLLSFFFNMVL